MERGEGMRVGELIRELQQYPPNTRVMLEHPSSMALVEVGGVAREWWQIEPEGRGEDFIHYEEVAVILG